MSSSALIRECTEQDRQGVLALFQQHFGSWSAERCSKRWQWQFYGDRGCRDCKPVIQVAEADSAIVGHIAAFPLPLRIGAKRLEVLCAVGFVVERDHRWAAFGLLKKLVSQAGIILGTSWSQAAGRLFRFHGALSLPLSNILYVYPLRHVGATRRELRRRLPSPLHGLANRWSSALVAPILDRRRGRKSKPLPTLDHSGDLRPISRFGEEYDELWRSVVRQFDVSLDKDSAYLNWRYIDCPTASPLCFGCYGKNSELTGVIIACLRAHRDVTRCPCGEDGEIVELIVRDPDCRAVEQMVVPVVEMLNRHGVDTVATRGLHPQFHPALEKIGFDRMTVDWGKLLLLSRVPCHPAADILRDDLWYFTSGDGDHLFDAAV